MKVDVQARDGAVAHFEAPLGQPLLHAGLGRAVGLPYECASGTCGSCKVALLAGEVHDAWPDAPGRAGCKPGEILSCQCSALSDLTLQYRGALRAPDERLPAPGSYAGTLFEPRRLTPEVIEFRIQLDRAMAFVPGQFVLVRVPGIAGARGWSMTNAEPDARVLHFVVKRKPGGVVSDWLFSGERAGTELEVFGPLGRATFHPEEQHELLCIAGGSGIAGMLAILRRAAAERYFETHGGDVFFGVRTMRDAFYLRELAALRRLGGRGLRIVIALSDEAASELDRAEHPLLEFEHGFVHEVAARCMEHRLPGVCAFLAGPPPAVDASLRLLLSARVPARNIRYDKFS